jgi:hypothetical protein
MADYADLPAVQSPKRQERVHVVPNAPQPDATVSDDSVHPAQAANISEHQDSATHEEGFRNYDNAQASYARADIHIQQGQAAEGSGADTLPETAGDDPPSQPLAQGTDPNATPANTPEGVDPNAAPATAPEAAPAQTSPAEVAPINPYVAELMTDTDFHQQVPGGCYYLSAVKGMLDTDKGREQIARMIHSDDGQTYQITYPASEQISIPVTVSVSLDELHPEYQAEGSTLVQLMEISYGKYLDILNGDKDNNVQAGKYDRNFTLYSNGGDAQQGGNGYYSLNTLTGVKPTLVTANLKPDQPANSETRAQAMAIIDRLTHNPEGTVATVHFWETVDGRDKINHAYTLEVHEGQLVRIDPFNPGVAEPVDIDQLLQTYKMYIVATDLP